MKKIIAAVAAACITVSTNVFPAIADDIISVYVDGTKLDFPVNPIIENDFTLVPMRAIFESLGAQIEWDGNTRTVYATKDNDTMSITIDNNTLYKNNDAIELGTPARIVNDYTLVPVRAVAEGLDAKVEWDGEERKVIITTNPTQTPTPIPSNTPTVEVTPVPSVTPTPEQTDIPKADKLSEADMNLLKSASEDIRYDFEQSCLPSYALIIDTVYDDLGDEKKINDVVTNYWNKLVSMYIFDIQANSETTYTIDKNIINAVNGNGVTEYYSDIIKDANLTSEQFISDVSIFQSDNGTRCAIITFKNTDGFLACKYIGIVKSKDSAARYFTAESDMFTNDTWFLGEITTNGRGTVSLLNKENDATDFDNFKNFVVDFYESSLK